MAVARDRLPRTWPTSSPCGTKAPRWCPVRPVSEGRSAGSILVDCDGAVDRGRPAIGFTASVELWKTGQGCVAGQLTIGVVWLGAGWLTTDGVARALVVPQGEGPSRLRDVRPSRFSRSVDDRLNYNCVYLPLPFFTCVQE